ncbi:MAG TPA: hypothetical protein VF815_22850 [Myxococcaceae bacterium]
MSMYVLTDGPVQCAMLKRMVRGHPLLRRRKIKVFEDSGTPAVGARHIMIETGDPTAWVAGTKTIDPGGIAEKRGYAEYFLGGGGPREMWHLTLVVPETTVLLFQNKQVLQSLLPGPLSFEQRIVARYEPTRILSEVFAQAGKPFPGALVRRIARADLSPLWKLSLLQPLERFLSVDPPPSKETVPLEFYY